MAGVTAVKEESQVAQQVAGACAWVDSLVIVRSLHVTTPPGELAQKKLLGEACANPFTRANRKTSEH